MEGRVAYARREPGKGEAAAQLGVEFVEPSDEARGALAGFIARELEAADAAEASS
jgi:hypothetical protein